MFVADCIDVTMLRAGVDEGTKSDTGARILYSEITYRSLKPRVFLNSTCQQSVYVQNSLKISKVRGPAKLEMSFEHILKLYGNSSFDEHT